MGVASTSFQLFVLSFSWVSFHHLPSLPHPSHPLFPQLPSLPHLAWVVTSNLPSLTPGGRADDKADGPPYQRPPPLLQGWRGADYLKAARLASLNSDAEAEKRKYYLLGSYSCKEGGLGRRKIENGERKWEGRLREEEEIKRKEAGGKEGTKMWREKERREALRGKWKRRRRERENWMKGEKKRKAERE